MQNTLVADRSVIKGDKITGMVVVGRYGNHVWSGEFNATYGDHKLSGFFVKCNLNEITSAYLHLADGTVALVDPYWSLRQE
jgi:hypothetical protein